MTTEDALKAEAETSDDARLILADYYAENGRPDLEWRERELLAVRPVIEDPDDAEARLEFAAFCEAQGRTARAEWIRLGVQLTRKPPCPAWCDHDPGRCDRTALSRRIAQIARAGDLWTAKTESPLVVLQAAAIDSNYRDGPVAYCHEGFIHTVTCTGDWWAINAPDLCRRHPVRLCMLTKLPRVAWGGLIREPSVRQCWLNDAIELGPTEVDFLDFPDSGHLRMAFALLRKYWPAVNFLDISRG